MLRNLFVPVGSALNPFQSGHATLLKLNAGVVGRLPARHTASLPIHTYAVINRAKRWRFERFSRMLILRMSRRPYPSDVDDET
ncbi:hypothetical protein, partial [Deinococcus reticulitermitis]